MSRKRFTANLGVVANGRHGMGSIFFCGYRSLPNRLRTLKNVIFEKNCFDRTPLPSFVRTLAKQTPKSDSQTTFLRRETCRRQLREKEPRTTYFKCVRYEPSVYGSGGGEERKHDAKKRSVLTHKLTCKSTSFVRRTSRG